MPVNQPGTSQPAPPYPTSTITKTRHRQPKSYALPLVFLFVSLLVLAFGFFPYLKNRTGGGWTHTDARVVSSTEHDSAGYNATTRVNYAPVFTYRAGSKSYTASGNADWSTKPVPGSSITIAYNPSDPAQAKVIERGYGVQLIITIIIAVLINVLGIKMYIAIRRASSDETPAHPVTSLQP